MEILRPTKLVTGHKILGLGSWEHVRLPTLGFRGGWGKSQTTPDYCRPHTTYGQPALVASVCRYGISSQFDYDSKSHTKILC